MKLIIALGNPDKKYAATRHNAGWLLADKCVSQWGFSAFAKDGQFCALVTRGHIAGEAVLVAKPLTYMNKSGDTVALLASYYKIKMEDIIVLQDDLDSEFGTVKVKMKGGHGGHNGIRDILRVSKNDAFARVKIGIKADKKGDTSSFVLGRFSTEEEQRLPEILNEAQKRLEELLAKK